MKWTNFFEVAFAYPLVFWESTVYKSRKCNEVKLAGTPVGYGAWSFFIGCLHLRLFSAVFPISRLSPARRFRGGF